MDQPAPTLTASCPLLPSVVVLGASISKFSHCTSQPYRMGKLGHFLGPSWSRLQAPGLASALGVPSPIPSHHPQKAFSSFPKSCSFILSLVPFLHGCRGEGTQQPGETLSPPPPHAGPASGGLPIRPPRLEGLCSRLFALEILTNNNCRPEAPATP